MKKLLVSHDTFKAFSVDQIQLLKLHYEIVILPENFAESKIYIISPTSKEHISTNKYYEYTPQEMKEIDDIQTAIELCREYCN